MFDASNLYFSVDLTKKQLLTMKKSAVNSILVFILKWSRKQCILLTFDQRVDSFRRR